jgi:endonuclease/exonuclease/phosphatase (EEP) superfamily protein YafD
MARTEDRPVTGLLHSSLVGMLLAGVCVAASLAHWAARAWEKPRPWSAAMVTAAITSGGLLVALTITRFALLSENGG